MTSYFNGCDVTVANSNYKNFPSFFWRALVPHIEKGSSTTGPHSQQRWQASESIDKIVFTEHWFHLILRILRHVILFI